MKKLFILFSLFTIFIQGLALPGVSAQTVSNDSDGQALFKKITGLADQLNQPAATYDTRIPYLINCVSQNEDLTPELSQFFLSDGSTLHAHSSLKDTAQSEQLGTPSSFPQLWIKYDNQGNLSEIGMSSLAYPTSFGIDPKTHPSLVLDFANKTATFP